LTNITPSSKSSSRTSVDLVEMGSAEKTQRERESFAYALLASEQRTVDFSVFGRESGYFIANNSNNNNNKIRRF
jgi:hypothetical protein